MALDLKGSVARVSKPAGSFLLAGGRCRAAQILGRSGSFALPNYEILGLVISSQSDLNFAPIQFRSGLNPTQSDPIQPNPTYAKKNKSPRNRVTPLLKNLTEFD
jgi:hypothetical protein